MSEPIKIVFGGVAKELQILSDLFSDYYGQGMEQ